MTLQQLLAQSVSQKNAEERLPRQITVPVGRVYAVTLPHALTQFSWTSAYSEMVAKADCLIDCLSIELQHLHAAATGTAGSMLPRLLLGNLSMSGAAGTATNQTT